jgi:hypothetical protein
MAHSLFFRGASLALVVFLLFPTLAAAGSAPVGTMRSEGTVFVDSSRVPAQSSIFNGDRVATAEGRASVTLPNGSSILIDRTSDASLRTTGNTLCVGLIKGKVMLRSTPGTPVQVETAGLSFIPNSKFPSIAEVAMLANGSVNLSVHRGAISVRGAGKTPVVVQAGRALTVTPQPMQKETPGTAAHGSATVGQAIHGFHLSHAASVMVIGAAVAATAAAIGIAVAANDEETPVSPAVP